MNGVFASFGVFLSHLHPLLVHLPIGGLVLLAILEVLGKWERWKGAAQNDLLILVFVCATAAASAASGWALGRSGGYDQQLLKWHQVAGFSLLGVCVIATCLRHLQLMRAYRVSLVAAMTALVITGHLGGSITHGRDFLTRSAPIPSTTAEGLDRPVFAGVVEPILQERCVSCHGPEKHKADLRLDTLEALQKGGQDGPVIKAGEPNDSSLIQRMLLPLEHDGHMPPEDHPQATPDEIALLEWWIKAGAPGEEKAADLKPSSNILSLLELEWKRSNEP